MDFQEQKKKQFLKKDKSSIGRWDFKIKNLCKKINKNKNYYTTSSCSGRVVLLKASSDKKPDLFLFKTHDKINFKDLKKVLNDVRKEYKGLIEFQMTCCILHVGCRSLEDAFEIVKKAKLAGWKRSGVMSGNKRFMVELISTEGLSFPIMDKGKLLVDDGFLKVVIKLVNKKFDKVWGKIERLEKIF